MFRWKICLLLIAAVVVAPMPLLGRESQAKGTKYAFLVGCSKYLKTEFRTLPFTDNDVTGFRDALLQTGFADDHIVVLYDEAKERRYLPEKDKILHELDLLLDGMGPGDTLVVALSGHGLQFKGDAVSYFVPVDGKVDNKSTLLALTGKDGLYERLKSCKAKQKLLIVNACRNDPTVRLEHSANKVELVDEDRDEVPEGLAAIYSCQKGQKSYFDPERKMALFFDHVIRAWKGEYETAGEVTLEKFFEQVIVKTKMDAYKTMEAKQTPVVQRDYHGKWVIGAAAVARPAPFDLARARPAEVALLRGEVLKVGQVTNDKAFEGQLKSLRKDKANSTKLVAVGADMANGKDPELTYFGALTLGTLAAELQDFKACESLCRAAVARAVASDSKPKIVQSYGCLIVELYDAKKYSDVVRICEEALEIETDAKSGFRRFMIQAIAKDGKIDRALQEADNQLRERDDWQMRQTRAWVLHEAGRYSEAAKAYEDVTQRISKDKGLNQTSKDQYIDRIRYIISTVYVQIDQFDKATDQLKILVDRYPDNATYQNDLGYFWADQGIRLQEAEALIRKAIELDRQQRKNSEDFNPAEDRDFGGYLDSLGWVLFKQKNYEEAKKYLSEAVKARDGEHLEIFDHLGDACLALGQRQAALEAWQSGLKFAGDNPPDRARKALVEKKIQEHK